MLILCTCPVTLLAQDFESPQSLDSLVANLDKVRLEQEVAAVGFTLVNTDRILWTGAWGIADRKSARPVISDTMFRIGSITKAFTGLALLRAELDGRISLDQPLKSFMPEVPYQNRWAERHPVTIAMLLEHTAGLIDMSMEEFENKDPSPLSLVDALAVRPASRIMQWPPGLHSEYSNSGAGVATYAFEYATGESYEKYVERELFVPLGMSSSGFLLTGAAKRRLATGYDTDGKTVIPYWHMIYRAFGAINTTPADMAPFLLMLMNRGNSSGTALFPADAIRRAETPSTTLAAGSGLRFGYGLGIYQWAHKGLKFYGHGGDADGYLARIGYNLDTGLGYFVVINAFNHDALKPMRNLIEDYIVADHPRATHRDQRLTKKPTKKLEQAWLARFVGTYAATTHRFPGRDTSNRQIEIRLDDGKLYSHTASRRRRYIPVTEWHFRRPGQPVASAAFVESDGTMYLQGEIGNYRRILTTEALQEP